MFAIYFLSYRFTYVNGPVLFPINHHLSDLQIRRSSKNSVWRPTLERRSPECAKKKQSASVKKTVENEAQILSKPPPGASGGTLGPHRDPKSEKGQK